MMNPRQKALNLAIILGMPKQKPGYDEGDGMEGEGYGDEEMDMESGDVEGGMSPEEHAMMMKRGMKHTMGRKPRTMTMKGRRL